MIDKYTQYQKQAKEHFKNGEWDKGIDVAKNIPRNWDFFQELPSSHQLPDHVINKIADHLGTPEDSGSSFYYELSNNLPDDVSNETLHKLADLNKDSHVESRAFLTHPNYKLSDEENNRKKVHDFFHQYETSVDPMHFAVVKSMYSGKPETVNFRGEDGHSHGSLSHSTGAVRREEDLSFPYTPERYPELTRNSDVIPHLKDHAKRVQEEVLKDKWIPKKMINGEPHILLHRGVAGKYADKIRQMAGADENGSVLHRNITAPTLSFSSWSTNPDVASRFAHREIEGEPTKKGVVIRKWMPVSSILHSGDHTVMAGQEHAHRSENEIIIGHPDEKLKFKAKDLLIQKPEHDYGRTSPVTVRPHPEKIQKSEKVSISDSSQHQKLKDFLVHEPEQKASKDKIEENGFDLHSLGYDKHLDSHNELHHRTVNDTINSLPKTDVEFEKEPHEDGKQAFHLVPTSEQLQKIKEEGLEGTLNNLIQRDVTSGKPNNGSSIAHLIFEHHPEEDQYHVHEMGSSVHDFHDEELGNIEKGLKEGSLTTLQAHRIFDHLNEKYPKEHLSKLQDILFGDSHPASIVHDAFEQHLKDNGEGHKKITVSDGEFVGGGYKPHSDLVKTEDYKTAAKKGVMLSFPAYIKGNHYRPDMEGIHYHTTVRSFSPENNTPDSVFAQAGRVDLKPPHEDTPISFGHLTSRNGDLIHAIFLHGDHENNMKEYRNKITDNSSVGLGQAMREGEFRPHVSVDKATWLDLKNKNPKTAKEAGIEFGNAEVHKGSEKTHSFERIGGELHKSESSDKQTTLNKLSLITEKRKLPCGQIGFLMHRGMDNKEYQDNHTGGQAKYKKQVLEWTPDYQKAKDSADKIVSAWIPEKSVLKSEGDKYLVDSEGPFYHAHPEIVKNNMFLKD